MISLRTLPVHAIRPKMWLGLLLVVVSIGASADVANASSARHFPGAPGDPIAAGRVIGAPTASVTGWTFAIASRGGTVTVNVSGTTGFVEQGVPTPTISDVSVGDFVALYGTAVATTVTASEVNIFVPDNGRSSPVAAGTVEATPGASATDLLIMTASGSTVTVDLGASTTYFEEGLAAASLSDVVQGERVVVFGSGTAPTVTASEIAIRRAPFASAGTVTSTSNLPDSFEITTWNGSTLTVDVSTSTIYTQFGATVSVTALTNGARVGVFGTLVGATITTGEIVIAEPKPTGAFVTAGTVTDSTGLPADFTVTTWNGTALTVDVSASTIYAEYGNVAPTSVNVTNNEFVSVFGTESGTTVTATEVIIAGSHDRGLFGVGGGHRQFGGFGFGGFAHAPLHGFGSSPDVGRNPGHHGHGRMF